MGGRATICFQAGDALNWALPLRPLLIYMNRLEEPGLVGRGIDAGLPLPRHASLLEEEASGRSGRVTVRQPDDTSRRLLDRSMSGVVVEVCRSRDRCG